MFMYVSMAHAMVCAFVPTSGAGMSVSGPMLSPSAWKNRRVMRWSSSRETLRGSNFTPPFPPPYGRFMSAHFHVIIAASAFTSSSDTCSW